jgi:hypothetical protein
MGRVSSKNSRTRNHGRTGTKLIAEDSVCSDRERLEFWSTQCSLSTVGGRAVPEDLLQVRPPFVLSR